MSSEKPTENVTESQLNAISTEVEQQIEAKLRGVKIQFKSVFDTIETLQSSQSIFQKEVNLKIGALTGHNTRKQQPKEEWKFDNIEEAIEYAKKLQEQKVENQSKKMPSVR